MVSSLFSMAGRQCSTYGAAPACAACQTVDGQQGWMGELVSASRLALTEI